MLKFVFALTLCTLVGGAIAQTPDTRRYPLSRSYLRGDIGNCFENTCTEADRAFRLGFWDDAARLYRAAKSCDDANQEHRKDMNARIELCRLKAEEELRSAALEARMAARNAIATARAADAQDLLRKFDRTGAYRLADFAYEYIAPPKGANYPCAQAILDAWQYSPTRYGAVQTDDESIVFQTPFCYEAAIGLGSQCLTRFFVKDKKEYVAVLSKQNRKLYIWDMSDLSKLSVQPVDSSFVDFDASPDGGVLVFFSEKEAVIRRDNGRELLRLPWGKGFIFRFSQSGDRAYVYAPQSGEIALHRLEIRRGQSVRNVGVKSNRASNVYAVESGGENPPYAERLGSNLRDFKVARNRLWLLYDEGLLAYQEDASESVADRFLRIFYFEAAAAERPLYALRLCGDLSVVCADQASVWFFGPPSLSAPDSLRLKGFSESQLLGVSKSGSLAASYRRYDAAQYALYTHDVKSGNYAHGAIMSEYLTEADFSSDLAWLATCTPAGALLLWRLQEGEEAAKAFIPQRLERLVLSDEGQTYLLVENDAVRVFDADHWDKPLAEIPCRIPADKIAEWALAHRGDWIALRHAADSLLIYDWKRRKGVSAHAPMPTTIMRFNADQSLLAIADPTHIRVIETATGRLRGQIAFENEPTKLSFIGKSNQLLVVYGVESGDAGYRQLIRIWDPAAGWGESVKLPRYSIIEAEVSPQGRVAAFSNGSDIRLFQLDRPDEEYSAIRSTGQTIQGMCFMPNESTLAVSYADGQIVLWNVADGKRIVVIRPALSPQMRISEIRFVKNGSALRMRQFKSVGGDRYVQTLPLVDVDPELIRLSLFVNNRQLRAFTSDQIREYELEEALSYPGNFERIAASEDLPLIRSFFSFYQEQAVGSNNIATVSEYCDKALYLYRRLDDNTREELRARIVGMYADYAWKLLLRERIAEAEKVNSILVQEFGAGRQANRIAAHLGLLRGNYPESARLFVQYLIDADDDFFEVSSELAQDFRQFEEYGLLNAAHKGFICGLMGDLINLDETCAGEIDPVYPLLPTATYRRWEAFKLGYAITYCEDQRLENLQRALELTQTLWAADNDKYQIELENCILRLAEWHETRALVEEDHLFHSRYLEDAVQYLKRMAPFKVKEKLRLNYMTRNRLNAAKSQIRLRRSDDALQICAEGLAIGQKLLDLYQNDPFESQFVKSDLIGGLKLQVAYANLYAERLAEASKAYKEAQELGAYVIAGDEMEGYLAYLRKDFDAMLFAFGNTNNEDALSDILYVLTRLQENEHGLQDDTLIRNLVVAFREARPNLDINQVLFLRAEKLARTYHVQMRAAEAIRWIKEALLIANKLRETKDENLNMWEEYYVGALISRAYFSLFLPNPPLDEVIALSEEALAAIQNLDGIYTDSSLALTNLAHALLIRNQTGDRQRALDAYRAYLTSAFQEQCPRMALIHDWQELLQAGVRMPDLRGAITQIFDDEADRSAALKAIEMLGLD